MFFTREDILKIQAELTKLGVKDSDFRDAHTPLDSNDILVLSQGGRNVKIRIQDFLEQLHLLSSDDFINVTTKFDAHHLSLQEAIQILPSKVRKTGLTITFQNIEGNWEIWQFTSNNIHQFNEPSAWENCKVSVDSIAIPDEEDLTMITQGTRLVTKFKDKTYDPANFSGMGRVYLRKNVTKVQDPNTKETKTVNLLTLKMLGKENTIYIIQYDYDLNGLTITVPAGCTLEFDGGSFSNGTIAGNNTNIIAGLTRIFSIDTNISGTWNIGQVYTEWFGAKANRPDLDCSIYIQKTINNFNTIYLASNSTYYLENPLLLNHNNIIFGNYSKLEFTINDANNPCCIKMGHYCFLQDIYIVLDEENSIQDVALVWFYTEYTNKTRVEAGLSNNNDYFHRSNKEYSLRNVSLMTKKSVWSGGLDIINASKNTGIKITGEDCPISGGIAFNFNIKGYFKYGIYIDISDASIDTKEGWFTSGRFINGTINRALVGIYVDSSSIKEKNEVPRDIIFSNLSIQTHGSHVKTIRDAGVDTRAIVLKECKDVKFNNCFIWDWVELQYETYYDTPAPVLITNLCKEVVFNNTGDEYIKLYDIELPMTSFLSDHMPIVKNTNRHRILDRGIKSNISSLEFKKFFFFLPDGEYMVTKNTLTNFIKYSSSSRPLYILDFDNLENDTAILRITTCNYERFYEFELPIRLFNEVNGYYLYRSVIRILNISNEESVENINFLWHRINVCSNALTLRNGFPVIGNRGEYFIDSGKSNTACFNIGVKKWVNALGYTPALNRGTSGKRPPLSTEETTPSGSITAQDVGFQYFDTTLNKPIWWTGSKWVDSTGADV